MKSSLAVIVFIVISSAVLSQQKLPYPINVEGVNELTAAMMPDSSILVASDDKVGGYTVKRFVFQDSKWVLASNQLTELLNSIRYEGSHLHFRFSNDFHKLVVMLHGKGDQRIYLTELQKNNQWSFFRDIIDPSDYSYFNFTPSFSNDNKVLYLSDRGKSKNSFWVYTNTDTFTEKKQDVFDDFLYVDDVVGIGNSSVLIHGAAKTEKEPMWFFMKQIANGKWSVPFRVKSIKPASTFALSITPFDNLMLYSNWDTGDLYLMETPAIIQKELQRAKVRTKDRQEVTQNLKAVSSTAMIKPVGQYYALLIGNSDYERDDLDLDKPQQDVQEFKAVLEKHYRFDPDNVIILENADREDIFSSLYQLRSRLTKDDNLLIFYAGHGFWDEKVEQGYWWPTDAVADNPSNWLSNSDLKEQIRGINTAHTLLISDACFSGGIFKTRGGEDIKRATVDVQLLYGMPSRRAITSGTMSTVPDNSVFFKYLIKYLRENDKEFLAASDLFSLVRTSVLNNSLTVPQDGVIMGTGDEGGDFIFIKKNNKE